MRMDNWLLPAIAVGLTVGCVRVAEPPVTRMSASATPMPALTPTATPPTETQPPVDEGSIVLSSSGARARVDLARRLRIDSDRIQVVEVATREPDEAVVSCLTRGGRSDKPWVDLEEVEWITLAAKDKVYHYVALDELVIYCDE